MIALWFFCCFLFAAESEVRVDTVLVDTSTVSFPVKRESKLKRTYNWLMDKLVRYDVSKLDTNYVNVPNKTLVGCPQFLPCWA